MSMIKVTNTLTVEIYNWQYCNESRNGETRINDKKCKYCRKNGGDYNCDLFEEKWLFSHNEWILRLRECIAASEIVESEEKDYCERKRHDI